MKTQFSRELIEQRVSELGPWFHNLDLHGVRTAPHHWFGDFPRIKWNQIAGSIPTELNGASVLDIGCNAGFYSFEMKRRGAGHVVGVDINEHALEQARFSNEVLGLDVEFRRASVYQLDSIGTEFDYVLFLGVLYHLRYPMFALDKVVKKVKHTLICQTLLRGSPDIRKWDINYNFVRTEMFEDPRFPHLFFIEDYYAGDPTNWWIPNRAAAEAMLRSAGLDIVARPEPECWVCVPRKTKYDGQYIVDLEINGQLPVLETTNSIDRSQCILEFDADGFDVPSGSGGLQ